MLDFTFPPFAMSDPYVSEAVEDSRLTIFLELLDWPWSLPDLLRDSSKSFKAPTDSSLLISFYLWLPKS